MDSDVVMRLKGRYLTELREKSRKTAETRADLQRRALREFSNHSFIGSVSPLSIPRSRVKR